MDLLLQGLDLGIQFSGLFFEDDDLGLYLLGFLGLAVFHRQANSLGLKVQGRLVLFTKGEHPPPLIVQLEQYLQGLLCMRYFLGD